MNECSNPHAIPSSETTADTPTARPRTVRAVRTPRRSRLRRIKVVKRMAGRGLGSGGRAEHQVAAAAPDALVVTVPEHAPADGGDVEVAVALDKVGELVAQLHQAGDDPAVEARPAD